MSGFGQTPFAASPVVENPAFLAGPRLTPQGSPFFCRKVSICAYAQ